MAKHDREYKKLTDDTKAAIEESMKPQPPPLRSVESLEREHYSHHLLREQAIADGDEEAKARAEANMLTLVHAIKKSEEAEKKLLQD